MLAMTSRTTLDSSRWRSRADHVELEALDTLDKTLAMKNPYGVVNPKSDWTTQMSRDFPESSPGKSLDVSKAAKNAIARFSA